MRVALGILAAVSLLAGPTFAETRVGVSWSHFQEERWKIDEAAMRAGLEAAGARMLSADAQSRAEKQLADVEGLLSRGIDVLVLVAHDADAIAPALRAARAEGVPVIAYDRLIEAEDVVYLSFDNREVGRIQAREVLKQQPTGRYVFIKGSPQDPNAHFVHAGQLDVLQAAIDARRITIVGDQFVEGWLPEQAQRTMEQILTANDDRVDAVVCSNDGMAGGVVAALRAQGLVGTPVSGQDGDRAALLRVAEGSQSVSVWKDARALGALAARVALELADGGPAAAIGGVTPWTSPRNLSVPSILLEPVAIVRENLDVVVDAGWITRTELCAQGASAPVCRAGDAAPASE